MSAFTRRAFSGLGVAVATAAATGCATAQTPAQSAANEEMNLWPGAAPGTEDWAIEERRMQFPLATVGVTPPPMVEGVTNVTVPTLSVYRPTGRATGAAVVVSPGGGFRALAIDHEGKMAAQRLAEWGVTAFLLKYRVRLDNPTPPAAGAPGAGAPGGGGGRRIAVADGLRAVELVRANAARFGIQADRVGMLGFSAGAMLSVAAILDAESAERRPNFVGSIYGGMNSDQTAVPADAPPIFLAAAQDDPQVPVRRSVDTFTNWTAARRSAELHVYENGGHGFGALPLGRASDQWIKDYQVWMTRHEYARQS